MLKRGFQFAPGYRLQEFLGRGQFGQVWRASAPGGAAAAVKFIDLSDGQGQKEYDAVRRVKQIRHANLMPITAIWLLDAQGQVIEEAPDEAIETIDLSVPETPGQSAMYRPEVDPSWLVVSMLLGGKSLLKRLQECLEEGLGGIPPKELISYMDEAAKGIDFLNSPQHDLGEGPIAIQHSDIKPANIVLIGSSAVVCDFGLARILTRNQVTATSAAGTPAYMAPEAITGKPSRTSDQYSLAVTYYHLRTGSLPVNDGSLWEVLDAHRHGKLKLGLVPDAEQFVLRKATDLSWENRFDTNVEFVDALREALRSEGETRPSVMNFPTAESPAAVDRTTVPVKADAAATFDSVSPELIQGGSLQEGSLRATSPLGTPDESTREDRFLNTTLPGLNEVPKSTSLAQPTLSMRGLLEGQRKWVAGISVTVLAILALVFFTGQGKEQGEEPPKTADELLAEAITLVDTDTAAATTLFEQALALDPGLQQPQPSQLPGQNGSVMKMASTRDGKQLVTMDDSPNAIVRDLSQPESPIMLKGHETLLNAIAIQSDSDLLLTGGFDSDARVWDLRAEDVAATPLLLSGHYGEVESIAWSPTTPLAITSSSNLENGLGEIGLWEIERPSSDHSLATIKRQRLIPVQQKINAIACDPTNRWVVAISLADADSTQVDVSVFDCDELWNRQGAPEPISLKISGAEHIAFLTEQTEPTLAIGEAGGTVSLYSITTPGKLIRQINQEESASQNHIEAMKVIATDQHDVIVAGTADGALLWWRYGNGSENRRHEVTGGSIGCIDVSADGRWVAAGTTDGSVVLWDTSADAGKGFITLVTDAFSVDSVAMADGSNLLAAGCSNGEVLIWNLAHLKLLTTKPVGDGIIERPGKDSGPAIQQPDTPQPDPKDADPKIAKPPASERPEALAVALSGQLS